MSGSQGEAKAQEWLRAKCQALGLQPVVEDFRYRADDRLSTLKSLALALGVVALTLVSLVASPWLVLLGIVLVFVLHSVIFRRLERAGAELRGANVLAGITRPWPEIQAARSPGVIFLCAHYDTAPSAPAWRLAIRRIQDTVAGLAFLGVVALVLFCIAYGLLLAVGSVVGWASAWASGLFGFWRALGVWLVLAAGLPATLVVLLTAITYQPPDRRPINPGADDNGSGVAVVLSLIEELAISGPDGWDLVAAFWGAEENGLWGSDAFVESHRTQLDPENTLIVNVDTVGRGNCLMAVSGEGVLRRRGVDGSLLEKWEQACRNVGACTIREWLTPLSGSSDHAAWLNAGFRSALSIGRGNLVPIALPVRLLNRLLLVPAGAQQTDVSHIHSPGDDMAYIRPEYLAETSNAIRAFVSLHW
jgi:hypothetical protein